MAERRMFAKTIIDSDAFLDMPMSSQALYFHLSMRADDDGFINNPKRIQRMIGASDDDMKLLIVKCFVLTFESGVIVIKHWKINNYIRNDRYKETVYQEEKSLLQVKENGAYSLVGIPNGYQMDTQYRLGKDRLDKNSLVEDKALQCNTNATQVQQLRNVELEIEKEIDTDKELVSKQPTLTELKNYISDKKLNVDPQRFFNYYSDKGWNKITDWKAAVEFWHRNERKSKSQFLQEQKAEYDMKELEKALLEKTIKEMGTDG
jgi:hypothetical protein